MPTCRLYIGNLPKDRAAILACLVAILRSFLFLRWDTWKFHDRCKASANRQRKQDGSIFSDSPKHFAVKLQTVLKATQIEPEIAAVKFECWWGRVLISTYHVHSSRKQLQHWEVSFLQFPMFSNLWAWKPPGTRLKIQVRGGPRCQLWQMFVLRSWHFTEISVLLCTSWGSWLAYLAFDSWWHHQPFCSQLAPATCHSKKSQRHTVRFNESIFQTPTPVFFQRKTWFPRCAFHG